MSQIEANSEFTNKKRASVSFLPNDPVAASFLEVCTSLVNNSAPVTFLQLFFMVSFPHKLENKFMWALICMQLKCKSIGGPGLILLNFVMEQEYRSGTIRILKL